MSLFYAMQDPRRISESVEYKYIVWQNLIRTHEPHIKLTILTWLSEFSFTVQKEKSVNKNWRDVPVHISDMVNLKRTDGDLKN